jgi:hypothetical protein
MKKPTIRGDLQGFTGPKFFHESVQVFRSSGESKRAEGIPSAR